MERFKHFAITLLIAVTSLTASAYSFEVDGIYYNVISENDLTCEVTNSNNKYSGDIIIPTHIIYNDKKYTVTKVGDFAFFYCTDLTSIEIQNTVTSIGKWAFRSCSKLKLVIIPNSVTAIEESAFDSCKALESIELPNSIKSIGDGAFSYCTSLTSINIPESVNSIGVNPFKYCYNLNELIVNGDNYYFVQNCLISREGLLISALFKQQINSIPNNVKEIGNSSFVGVAKGDLYIPNSVNKIGDNAFETCQYLSSINIPSSVEYIGTNPFKGCDELVNMTVEGDNFILDNDLLYSKDGVLISVIRSGEKKELEIPSNIHEIGECACIWALNLKSLKIPNSVTSIKKSAFFQAGLDSINIPNSVKIIEGFAFESCDNLLTVTIGDNVESIGEWCFAICPELSYIKIGKNVKTIGEGAFCNSKNIKNIVSLNTYVPRLEKRVFEGINVKETHVYVPEISINDYQNAEGWKDFLCFEGLKGEEYTKPEIEQCAAPTIEFENGKLKITSATVGASFHTTVKTNDYQTVEGPHGIIELTGIYNISTYAYAYGYQKSDTVTATLVWVNPTLEGSTDVISMEATKAVLIRSNGNSIIISGTEYGERVDLYDISGNLINTKVADDGETIIPCNTNKGEIIVVKYGDKAVKCRI